MLDRTVVGASSPHTPSIRSSTDTTRPALTANIANSARPFTPPSATTTPSTAASTAPSNSTANLAGASSRFAARRPPAIGAAQYRTLCSTAGLEHPRDLQTPDGCRLAVPRELVPQPRDHDRGRLR